MTDKDDRLLADLARRNWYILGGLLLLSLLWRSMAVTKGVLAGGLIAIIAYGWLHRSAAKALAQPDQGAPRRYQRTYIVRLAAVGTAIFLLIAKGGVSPLALSAGLSVVVINVIWTTWRRMI
jgi:hypothetical protein